MSEFTPFENRLAGMLASLSPAARRKLAADIARKLRINQQKRIKRQMAPDGTPYTPRKRQEQAKGKGRIKRMMFAKLSTNRFMTAKGTADAATVEFVGRVKRIARIHQDGLRDKPNPYAKEIQYQKRELLGVGDDDRRIVEDAVITHLQK